MSDNFNYINDLKTQRLITWQLQQHCLDAHRELMKKFNTRIYNLDADIARAETENK